MRKRIIAVAVLTLIAVACTAAFAACSKEVEITKANVEKIDSTMDYAAVKALIGEASRDLRPEGSIEGRVAWNHSADNRKTTSKTNVFIDFGEDGKVAYLEARKETHPREGGISEIDWEVKYPRQ